MRFFENGPSIPDDLLIARDEGRVVFFCGAGVSACARLPDFYGLAESVLKKLRVPSGHITYKVLAEAKEIGERTGASGLISADRIFGLLEGEFSVRDVEEAVATTLKPKEDADLSAHRIMLDLATTTEGTIKLVTTNFDRLFETAHRQRLDIFQPPHLPNIARTDNFNGVIHLHGIAGKSYDNAEGDGFILSSSAFGRAYLAEGWATQFFRDILEKYTVVFIGYGANDPPVQYLLEGLNKKSGTFHNVYFFQEGTEDEAQGKWSNKGIQAIAYDSHNQHSALWETLAAWAERAKSPENWYQSIIRLAQQNPSALQPFQRGQVAHVISTLKGARKFAENENAPPAEWLCVFDPYQRYKPSQIFNENNFELGKLFNSFQHYALDSDSIPQHSQPNNQEREVPATAWDAFALNPQDHQVLVSNFRGYFALNAAGLSARLWQLGIWLSHVADQPIAVWWASKQIGLHPNIQSQIERLLNNNKKPIHPTIQQAWHYLFEIWQMREDQNPFGERYQKWNGLKTSIDNYGWSSRTLRLYANLSRPYLCIEPYNWRNQQPPVESENIKLADLLNISVQYRQEAITIHFPDEWLAAVIRELRKNLEHALQLEMELDSYQLQSIGSIYPETNQNNHIMELDSFLFFFSKLFKRLSEWNISVAQEEFATWLTDDETIFSRLRIWAVGIDDLVCDQTFVEIILKLNEDVFWGSYSQRDLLLTLVHRWNVLPEVMKKQLEIRLLSRLSRYQSESEEEEYKEINARITLNRLHWLAQQGCQFTFNLANETRLRQKYVLNWTPQWAKNAADSMGVHSSTGRHTDETFSELLLVNLADILIKASELTGRSEDFTVTKDPYSGLCKSKPVRAFSALTHAAKNGEFSKWAWEEFFYSLKKEQENENPSSSLIRFWLLIIERISSYPVEKLVENIGPITYWLKYNSKPIATNLPKSYRRIIVKIIKVLEFQSLATSSATPRRNKSTDWIFEAINSTAGHITDILLNDPVLDDQKNSGLPSWWLLQINKLLALPGDLRRYVLVILTAQLNWLFFKNPQWTEENLLAVLATDDNEDKQAFWNGFLRSCQTPNQELYMILKQDMLGLVKDSNIAKRGHEQTLAGFILAGWGSLHDEVRCVSNEELCSLILLCGDEFRSHIIWHLETWSKDNEAWKKLLTQLLEEVWPLQLAVKTPATTKRLFDLTFSDAKQFEAIADSVPRLLGTMKRSYLSIDEGILDAYPAKILTIFHTVFTKASLTDLPYDLEAALERIGQADVLLKKDKRWLELKHKLHEK